MKMSNFIEQSAETTAFEQAIQAHHRRACEHKIALHVDAAIDVVDTDPAEADAWAYEAGKEAWEFDIQTPEKLASHPALSAAFKRGFDSVEQQSRSQRDVEIFIGASLRINVPEFFKDAEFIDWLNNGARKFTWHETGHNPEEWSDVIVMVDPGFTGEGSDSDMPAHIWSQIVEICRAKLGGSVASRDEHITVRLTNIAH